MVDEQVRVRGGQTVTFRHFRVGDEQAMVDLQNVASFFDRTDQRSSLIQLSELLEAPFFNPARDMTLAESDGRLVAFQWQEYHHHSDGHLFYAYGFTHPDWRRRGLGAELMGRAYASALERRKSLQGPAFMVSSTFAHEPGRLALLHRFGMQPVRYYCQFSRPTLDDLPDVPIPDGIAIRNYRPGVDQAQTLAALDEAFRDQWSYRPGSTDLWAHWTSRPERRFDLWFLAWDGDEIAGACLCELAEAYNQGRGTKSGLVDDVAVRRPWRRRGLGAALLVAGLRALRNAGMTAAHLHADADNITGAVRIYERLGFVEEWRVIEHRCAI
jgi:mycothiol synthase